MRERLFKFIKESDETVGENAKVIRFWQRRAFATYQEITVLVKHGEKSFRYYYIMRDLESDSFT